ncbi:glycoside hydrolase family 15 protein [Candidatus Micrarchaeota archaeon]|nr:glycoside hydrolase family 15 protein [Candidatus Micrarchaeota archaeon]
MTFNYGVIGNCRTAALVKENSSIEWLCLPRFDSPTAFAKLLTGQGGEFGITPIGEYKTSQTYMGDTNILETAFEGTDGEFSVIDYFPMASHSDSIHRIVRLKRGKPRIKIRFNPKMNYARGETSVKKEDGCIIATDGKDRIYLYSDIDYDCIINEKEVVLEKSSLMIISFNCKEKKDSLYEDLEKTGQYWKTVVNRIKIPESAENKGMVIRSALVLELLRYLKTGTMVAAATTSLPEIVGDVRNWDYRYFWLRDSALTVRVLTKLGDLDVGKGFLDILLFLCSKGPLQVLYGVEGERNIEEFTLDHFDGYKGSRPVRIGNAAYDQLQIDVNGEILDAVHRYITKSHYDKSSAIFEILENLIVNTLSIWEEKDQGIWEFRGIREHFLFSKFMAWVALDRGIKIAEYFRQTENIEKLKVKRDIMRETILQKGWNMKKQAFTMYYGADELDASVLVMHKYGFIDAKDPRFIATVKAIEKELVEDGLAFRYKMKDDFGYPVNTFSIATCWFIEALFAIGEEEKAKELFRNFLSYSNHLGLFSEGINPKTKELTGNFPQAYTHMAIIETAIALGEGSFR